MIEVKATPEMLKSESLFLFCYDMMRLNEFVHDDLPLETWGFAFRNPLRIINFYISFLTWTPDIEVYKLIEHWPTTILELKQILINRKDDCDGIGILAISTLQTRGFKSDRIVVGGYNSPCRINHLWGWHFEEDDRYLVECTGNTRLQQLPLASDVPGYTPLISADTKDIYFHGNLAEKYI